MPFREYPPENCQCLAKSWTKYIYLGKTDNYYANIDLNWPNVNYKIKKLTKIDSKLENLTKNEKKIPF